MNPIVFDRSKATYDECGYVVINDIHREMLREALPRLKEALQEKWGARLRAWISEPVVTSAWKWFVHKDHKEDFRWKIERFLEGLFDDGMVCLDQGGTDGYMPSRRSKIHEQLAPIVETCLLNLPVDQALKDMIRVATGPDGDDGDEWDEQAKDARFELYGHLSDTVDPEMGALFFLTYGPASEVNGWFTHPDEVLEKAWDVIIDELPDELKSLHRSVYDSGPCKAQAS